MEATVAQCSRASSGTSQVNAYVELDPRGRYVGPDGPVLSRFSTVRPGLTPISAKTVSGPRGTEVQDGDYTLTWMLPDRFLNAQGREAARREALVVVASGHAVGTSMPPWRPGRVIRQAFRSSIAPQDFVVLGRAEVFNRCLNQGKINYAESLR